MSKRLQKTHTSVYIPAILNGCRAVVDRHTILVTPRSRIFGCYKMVKFYKICPISIFSAICFLLITPPFPRFFPAVYSNCFPEISSRTTRKATDIRTQRSWYFHLLISFTPRKPKIKSCKYRNSGLRDIKKNGNTLYSFTI